MKESSGKRPDAGAPNSGAPAKRRKLKKIKRYIPICVMALLAASAAIFILRHGDITPEMLLTYTPKDKPLAAAVIILLYALKSQTVIVPYVVIATAAGRLFDIPAALAVNTAGTVVCISVPYFMGRASDGVLTDKLLEKSPRLRRVYEQNKDNTFLVSLVLRVLNLSNDLLGLFFGSLRVSYAEYLSSSFIGIVPAMVLYTVLGRELDIFSAPVLICAGIEVACVAAAWLSLRARRRKKEGPHA